MKVFPSTTYIGPELSHRQPEKEGPIDRRVVFLSVFLRPFGLLRLQASQYCTTSFGKRIIEVSSHLLNSYFGF